MPYFAEYAATKHYMSAFTAGLRAELGRGSGVVIQEVDPGQVDTNMARNLIPISRVRDTLEESVVVSNIIPSDRGSPARVVGGRQPPLPGLD